jgi:hypothetical protein
MQGCYNFNRFFLGQVFRKDRTPMREGAVLQVAGTLRGIDAREAHFEIREALSLWVMTNQLSYVITSSEAGAVKGNNRR